ncbi:esterase-like activity of phytase family protein [Subtercola endophyticus]|uniref:esterase-like activity of phytase family protein n=1 Tax=Subtercola endophyticus TaxID=2895559 RepID=UPI001E61AF98|nr:esterase-like activity of phytase family protein [Subtercola endophyticus]UFS58953.1 esterase-like activity of phytase family protein [Subtercola endophyticus]
MRKHTALSGAGAAAAGLGLAALLAISGSQAAQASPAGVDSLAASAVRASAAADASSSTTPGTAVAANAFGDNTGYGNAVLAHTAPSNGTVSIDAFGNYTYTPNAGFTGTDTFTVSSSDAVKLFSTDLPALGTFGGVIISAGGYGSSVTTVPGKPGFIYGLTDRGPNVDGPNGTKIEAIPSFTPAIGEFQLVDGQATLVRDIPLKASDGTPLNGQVNSQASTGETITDLDGNVLPSSPYGFDSEGLVALPDGTFWVSDEYGPYVWHFDSNGTKIGGFSAYDGTLPAELKLRNPNQGLEGLTITPDGKTLVGLMQSSLVQADLNGIKPKAIPVTRLVTIPLDGGQVREYPYLLSDPGKLGIASSEITALSNTTFLVDERDGNLPPATATKPVSKKIYQIDISGATDIGPASTVPNSTYDAANGGLLLTDAAPQADAAASATADALPAGTSTVEGFAAKVSPFTTAAVTAALTTRGITPVAKSLYLDLGATLGTLSPDGSFFGHDKIEGIYPLDAHTLLISNDSDFGLSGSEDGVSNPFVLVPKILADGTQDDGQYLEVDTSKLPATPVTTTVSITVEPAAAGGGTSTPTPTPGDGASAGSGSGSGPTSGSSTASGTLANTGLETTVPLLAALALLLAGAATFVATRRRAARSTR